MHKKLIFAAAVLALLATTVALNPVQAARGGNGGGNHDNGTLAVYQGGVQVSSVAPGSAIEVRGSGFGANKTLYVGWAGQFGLVPVTTNDSGDFVHATTAPDEPGTYDYVALKYSRKNWVVAASVELVVN